MKGTIISILVGALLGVALTLGSAVRASHAASRPGAPIDAVSNAALATPFAPDGSTPALHDDERTEGEPASAK